MAFDKIAGGLPGALGKTVAGAFLAEYSRERWRVILAFTDGTHYELYGEGSIDGSRSLEAGSVDELRARLMDAAAARVVEVSPETLTQARRSR